jgi:hypothetical protein
MTTDDFRVKPHSTRTQWKISTQNAVFWETHTGRPTSYLAHAVQVHQLAFSSDRLKNACRCLLLCIRHCQRDRKSVPSVHKPIGPWFTWIFVAHDMLTCKSFLTRMPMRFDRDVITTVTAEHAFYTNDEWCSCYPPTPQVLHQQPAWCNAKEGVIAARYRMLNPSNSASQWFFARSAHAVSCKFQ